MHILLALAFAAPGDYRDWIDAVKAPNYFNPADAANTFASFKHKARDAKSVASASNVSSLLDFAPVSVENGFILLDQFTKDAGAALGAESVARDALDALGAMTAKQVMQKTKYGLLNMKKPTLNKMMADKAREVRDTVAHAMLQGKPKKRSARPEGADAASVI